MGALTSPLLFQSRKSGPRHFNDFIFPDFLHETIYYLRGSRHLCNKYRVVLTDEDFKGMVFAKLFEMRTIVDSGHQNDLRVHVDAHPDQAPLLEAQIPDGEGTDTSLRAII